MGKKSIIVGGIVAISIGMFLAVTASENTINFTSIIDDGIHTYSVQTIPQYANSQMVQSAITEGINKWEERNPDLDFKQVESGGDFEIIWIIKIAEITGTGDHLGYYDGENIAIEIGNEDCNKRWQQYSRQSIADTVTHEVGHYLGLKHHASETHLMYGFGDPKTTQNPYDDLGYAIPFKNQIYQKWTNAEDLERKINEIQKENDVLKERYKILSDEYEEKYEVIEDQDTYDKAEILFEELHVLNSQINENIEEYNELAKKFNCFSNYQE